MSLPLLFALMLLSNVVITLYLSVRHTNSVKKFRGSIPEAFTDTLSLEDHQKAADYTITNQQFSRLTTLIDACLLCFWVIAGGLTWLDQAALTWLPVTAGSIEHGLLVFAGFAIISGLLHLPFSWYSTFVLEARFGFNQSTQTLFWTDKIKQTFLALTLGGLLAYAVLWLMQTFSDTLWWVWVWMFIVAFNLVMIMVYPRYLAPIFNQFKPLEEGELKQTVSNLLTQCGFNAEQVFVMDGSKRSSHGNAYFTGLGKNKRVVFFDTLIERLTPEQIKAVLAHELGHSALKHIPKMLISSLFKLLVSLWLLSLLIDSIWIYEAFSVTPSLHMALLLFLLITPLISFLFQPISNRMSRKHEFEADAYASKHASGDGLITALLKLYSDNAVTLTPDPLYSAWYASHPPAAERISAIKKLKPQ